MPSTLGVILITQSASAAQQLQAAKNRVLRAARNLEIWVAAEGERALQTVNDLTNVVGDFRRCESVVLYPNLLPLYSKTDRF